MQDQAVNELPWTGERLVPTCRGQILYEHLHRYAVAVTLAHGKRVLDIACGEGYGSNLLAAAGAEVIGIDIAPDVIAHAKRAYPRQNLIFREGSCLNIPVDDKSIDLVVSFETIEHLDDHEQFLREIKRVLSDSGALIISSPDKREYTDRIGNKNRFHKLELNHEDFYSLLKKHFKNCRIAKQRLVVGSWIAPDKTSAGDVPGTFGGDIGSVDFQGGVPQGIYSIALCSDASLPKLKFGIFEDSRESKNTWALLERSNSTPTLQVFADCGEGFVDACSMVANLQPDAWQTIHFENFERISAIGSSNVQRLRVDPVDRPACVIISRILITGYSDGATIYSAASPAEFDAIRCSAGLLKHSGEEGLFLIATDADPQLYLPHFDLVTSNPCRFELTLKISLNPTEAVTRYHRALRDNSLLRETLRVSEDSKKQINELRTKNDQQREELRALTREAAQAQRQIQATESENTLLSNRLVALEQNVRDFANTLGLNRQGLGRADSPTAALIRSLSRSIRQLRWKAFFWKVAKLLGLKAIAGINPRSAASQLKRELEGVKRILKSKKTSPGGALAALTALIFLRRRATTHFTRSRAMSSRDSAAMQALFDQFWYTKTHPAAATTPMPPLQYYLTLGVKEGHNPHPLFDVNWYLSRPPRLENLEISPLEHYAGHGPSDERSPHPQFDSAFYIAQCPDCLSSDLPPLAHYLTTGWKLGCRPNPNFDPKFYLQTYPEVAAAKIEPLTHYVLWGQSEGRYSCQENVPFRFSTPDFEIPRTPLSSDSVIVPRVKAIAFYLPQFHPIPENDRWWGEGFTEWNNVRSGSPNYPDHYQPHVPIDLGYYDLRDPEVLRKQTELARTYGISGFCFYYYWFGGKVLLDLPIRTMLKTGQPDFPFCICWANENWTKRWDGREEDVLIAQNHSNEDDDNFIEHIEQVLLQKNYIRVNGKPLLLVYRPSLLPSAVETTARWRNYFRRRGHGDLHLTMVRSFYDQTEPQGYGFDAAVQFPPHFPAVSVKPWIPQKNEGFAGDVHDYLALRKLTLEQLHSFTQRNRTYPGVAPSWDNTARRGRDAIIWANSSPEAYYEWLSAAADEVQKTQTGDERLLFINAWNEWGEGCHLEPDVRYRYAWLNATRLALEAGSSRPDAAGKSNEPYVLVISHDAALAGAQVLLLNLLRQWKKRRPFAVRVICVGAGELRKEFEKCFPTLVLADFVAKAEQDYALAEFLKGSPRVIYSSTVVNGPLLAQLRPLGAKIVTHAHELQKSIERWAPGEIMAATLKHSAFFLAGSGKVAENLSASHGVPKDRLGVVYDFIESWGEEQEPDAAAKAAMREELGIGVGDVVVFGCGTTDWRKGPDLFLEIARLTCSLDDRLKFVWIGGDPAPFMEKVRSVGLEGRVLFVGSRMESRRYYYTGHIFLLSSREDPCPLVALEAADAGLPIVCFADAGDIPGFVGEECGVVVPYEDVRAAAQAVVRLAGDAQLRRSQGAEGRRRVVERHSSDSAASQIEALFDRLAPELQPASTRAKSREEEPLVSVIVPNYNHEKYLPERLRSITGQTYENMEIILLDDASTDDSWAILQKFASNEKRARFVPNEQNSGSTFKQWRKGLSQARGKYVWLAESDDTAEPAFLETLVGKLEANPGLSLAYCQVQMMSLDGEKLGTPEEPWLSEIDPLRWNTDFVNDGIDEIRRSLLVKNTILNASGVVFRNAEGIADLVDDSMRLCADWLFWVRLLQRGGVAYIAKPLSQWRLQSSNARKRPPGELEWLEGERVLVEAVEILKLTSPERDRILLDFLRKCWAWRLEAVPLERESVPKK